MVNVCKTCAMETGLLIFVITMQNFAFKQIVDQSAYLKNKHISLFFVLLNLTKILYYRWMTSMLPHLRCDDRNTVTGHLPR